MILRRSKISDHAYTVATIPVCSMHVFCLYLSSSHVCIQLGLYHLPLMTHVRDHWEVRKCNVVHPQELRKGKGPDPNPRSIEKTEGSGFIWPVPLTPHDTPPHPRPQNFILLTGHESSYPECFFAANLYEMRKTCGSVHELIQGQHKLCACWHAA